MLYLPFTGCIGVSWAWCEPVTGEVRSGEQVFDGPYETPELALKAFDSWREAYFRNAPSDVTLNMTWRLGPNQLICNVVMPWRSGCNGSPT